MNKHWAADGLRCLQLRSVSLDACNLTLELETTMRSMCNGGFHLKRRSQESSTGGGGSNKSFPDSPTLEWGRVKNTKPSSWVCSNGHNVMHYSLQSIWSPFDVIGLTLTLLHWSEYRVFSNQCGQVTGRKVAWRNKYQVISTHWNSLLTHRGKPV